MQSVADDSGTENTAVVERFVDAVWNGEAPDAIDELAIPDLVVHQLAAENDLVGREEFTEFETAFREAVPDMRQTIRRTVVEGE